MSALVSTMNRKKENTNMAATVSGPATLTQTVAPHLTATILNAVIRIAPENLTRANIQTLLDAINRYPAGDPTQTVGTILS